jgi:hypothetical protein
MSLNMAPATYEQTPHGWRAASINSASGLAFAGIRAPGDPVSPVPEPSSKSFQHLANRAESSVNVLSSTCSCAFGSRPIASIESGSLSGRAVVADSLFKSVRSSHRSDSARSQVRTRNSPLLSDVRKRTRFSSRPGNPVSVSCGAEPVSFALSSAKAEIGKS